MNQNQAQEKKVLANSVAGNTNAERPSFSREVSRETELLSYLSLGPNKPQPPAKKKNPGANLEFRSQLPGQQASQSQVQRQGGSQGKQVIRECLMEIFEHEEDPGMTAKLYAFTSMYQRCAEDADSLVDLVKNLDSDLRSMECEMRDNETKEKEST